MDAAQTAKDFLTVQTHIDTKLCTHEETELEAFDIPGFDPENGYTSTHGGYAEVCVFCNEVVVEQANPMGNL